MQKIMPYGCKTCGLTRRGSKQNSVQRKCRRNKAGRLICTPQKRKKTKAKRK